MIYNFVILIFIGFPIRTLLIYVEISYNDYMIQAGKKKIHEYKFAKFKTEFEENDCVYSQKIFASDTEFTNHTNNVRYVKYTSDRTSLQTYACHFFHIILSYVEIPRQFT